MAKRKEIVVIIKNVSIDLLRMLGIAILQNHHVHLGDSTGRVVASNC